jgi:hypothetical protein
MSANAFELPKNLDDYLAALSKLCEQDGKRRLQEIIVNARIRIVEGWTSDNWDGGTYGHALFLTLPESLYLQIVNQRDDLQTEIRQDLNKIHNVQREFIAEVFIEMEVSAGGDWRKESGLLAVGQKSVSQEAASRIWGDPEDFRVFLSHKVSVKVETAALKEKLGLFGISGFVAHEDIHPTTEWQTGIENALASMDGFVALMTPDFHESLWTDQEVGFAFARGVPIIAVRLGLDPYGFIGKFQGLSSNWITAHKDVVRIFIKHERMFSAYIRKLRTCPSWDAGNVLGEALEGIDTLSDTQVEELISAYNETSELRGSFAFNGTKRRYHGPGLPTHLMRITGRQFKFGPNGDTVIAV